MYKLSLNHEFKMQDIETLGLSTELFKGGKYRMHRISKNANDKKELMKIFSNNGFILRQRLHKEQNIYITGIEKSWLMHSNGSQSWMVF